MSVHDLDINKHGTELQGLLGETAYQRYDASGHMLVTGIEVSLLLIDRYTRPKKYTHEISRVAVPVTGK